jgi:hypothetical protein
MAAGRHRAEPDIREPELSEAMAELARNRAGVEFRGQSGYCHSFRHRGVNLPHLQESADFSLVSRGIPNRVSVAEFKMVDEGRPWRGIERDYRKLTRFGTLAKEHGVALDRFLCAMVCDLNNGIEAEQTIAWIENELGLRFLRGPRTAAVDGGWGYIFICGQIPDVA